MKKETILVIAHKDHLGLLAKWAKEETGFETKRFDIRKGFPNGKEISDIENIFILIPPVSNKNELILFTNPHVEKFFHDKKIILELKARDKKIEEFENKLRPIFRNNFKKEEKTFSSSKFASS